jgi:CheY-like chemotaxis protein/HPt (histidine-containing phosphotransfer) domain-containing protein
MRPGTPSRDARHARAGRRRAFARLARIRPARHHVDLHAHQPTLPSPPPAMTTTPRLLLVEDEPVSQDFLASALEALPAVVDCAGSIAEARRHIVGHPHALWLVDVHLPDASGPGVLAALRAAGGDAPALALTASTDAALHARLREAGFLAVLGKPIGVAELQAAVVRVVGSDLDVLRVAERHDDGPAGAADAAAGGSDAPPRGADDAASPWDEAAALATAGGRASTRDALRVLFLRELPELYGEVLHAVEGQDPQRARGALHRMKASCGFVGATRLLAETRRLHQAPLSSEAFASWRDAADELLALPLP